MEVSMKLRAMLGMGTASLFLNSVGRRSHKACPDSRGWRNGLSSLREVGRVTLHKSQWVGAAFGNTFCTRSGVAREPDSLGSGPALPLTSHGTSDKLLSLPVPLSVPQFYHL